MTDDLAKAIAIAFWLVAGPIVGIGIIYAVGETVEAITASHGGGNDR